MPFGLSTWSLTQEVGRVLAARYYLRSAETMGPRTRVLGRPVITNHGTLRIGDRVRLLSTIATLQIDVGPGAELEIGDRVFVNYGCSIGATKYVRIGARSSIGTHVIIMDNDFHSLDPDRREEVPESRPIIIEDNVWIGARAIILRGVTIGEGSVIGAGSVVTRSVPSRSIAAGMPAKVIRSL